MQEDKLVILDEVQRLPGLFQTLRSLIDRGRQHGHRNGRFLVLGSASLDLLRQSAESLAGRIVYVELKPEKGFYQACADLNPAARYVVFPGTERFPVSPQVEAIGLCELAAILHAL
jgi:hypothetical protein